jgi:putative oxidoreductase
MEALFIIGRVTLGVLAIVAGLSHFLKIGHMTRLARSNGVPLARQIVFLTGVALILSGLGVAFWLYIEAALWFLACFFVAISLWIHKFWKKQGSDRNNDLRLFVWNMMLAGLLFITLAVI